MQTGSEIKNHTFNTMYSNQKVKNPSGNKKIITQLVSFFKTSVLSLKPNQIKS